MKDIAGMRDKIIHFYFGIKWNKVWSAIKDKLPKLKECVEENLREKQNQI
ncbi:MAG: HepT-like ribonuclease domain-containing protein [Thermoproteota archaeon]